MAGSPNLGRLVSKSRLLCRSISTPARPHPFNKTSGKWSLISIGATTAVGLASVMAWKKYNSNVGVVYARQRPTIEEQQASQLTPRERRFIRFASVEYEGQLYMTPQDFLESVTDSEPRPRVKRKKLTKKELDHLHDKTPPRKKGSIKLFRSLHDTGIISYTEYLFLLSVLTKPHSGFHIAFNMFDTDGNQRVDKREFLVVLHVLASSFFRKSAAKMGAYQGVPGELLEKIFSTVARKGNILRGSTTSMEGRELVLYSSTANLDTRQARQ